MRLHHIFLIGLFSTLITACQNSSESLRGTDVTEEFLSQYNGDYKEQKESETESGERISLHRDGSIEVTKLRQVGSEESTTVPYPTVCSFILRGKISYVIEIFEQLRQRTNKDSGETYLTPETHEIFFTTESAELTNSLESTTTSNPHCQNYIDETNQLKPPYSYAMELFGNGTLRLHTHGGGDYNGGIRTESTLDEIYIRQ